MTAEIAVMNRQAVALAADSAVTIDLPRGQKIYNTVNKLFMLSKYAPVGIMVYGNANITGVPWETIIKEFRRELDDTRFSTVQQYAEAFLSFIESKSTLFPRDQQAQEVKTHAFGLFNSILDEVKAELERLFIANGSVREGQVRSVLTRQIRESLKEIESLPDMSGYTARYRTDLGREFRPEIDQTIELIFEKMPIGTVGKNRLREVFCSFMSKDAFPNQLSGVVVAGFGEDEHFPSIHSYDAQSVLMGKLKHKASTNTGSISANDTAIIVPFAQREMVDLFMRGVAPAYERAVQVAIDGFLGGLPDVLIDGLPLSKQQRSSLKRKMRAANQTILAGFDQHLTDYSMMNHVSPVVNAVATLPKEELAEMAESLVNLTSFKRRVTMDPETVGGPIDVAVISKGDGFVWIRRKHYFKPEFNHHFFANYYE